MNKSVYFELARVYWECQAHFGLSNGATSLYFYLLHRFNQARWPKTLAVSSLEIGGILGISKPSLLKFKDELAGCGILTADFQAGRIKQTYCLKSVATNFAGVEFEDLEDDPSKAPSKAPGKAPGKNSLPYISKDKDKDNNPIVPLKGREREKQASEIYDVYPKKAARPVAIRAIRKHLDKIGYDTLLKKTQAYAEAVKDSDPKFIPHPATWFNQERFNDDPESWKTSQGSAPKGNIYRWMNREKELKEKMRNFKNAHRSEMPLGVQWDPGTREKYNEMAKELESLRMTLDEISE